MRTRSAWFAVVACAYTCASAGAQTVLSERDVLDQLAGNNPRARAIRSAVDVSRAEALVAGRWPNPRVTVDRESVAGVSEVLTTVLQPLPITGRRRFEQAAATATAEATDRRADEELRRLRAEIRLAYQDLVAAQIRERELVQARDRLETLAALLVKREAAGDAAGFDRLRAEREVLEAEADRLEAAIDRARAQAHLAGFLPAGVEASTLVVEEPAPTAAVVPTLESLVERAAAARGEFLALQKDLESARLSARAAQRRRIPEPEVMGGTKSSSGGTGNLGSVLGLQAVIPLWDRGKPEKALADARASQAAARLDALRAATAAEISVARTSAIQRRQAADRYRASVLTSTGEIERIAQVSYDAGERGILELLDAYRTSSSARVRQVALDAAARQAEIELEFVSGWEIP